MDFGVELTRIPGTILDREKMGGATGMEFLNKIFYITDGIMLAQIREIAGVDGTTLQNWLKRGWVINPKNKMYNKDQLARILIINMMRNTMQLSDISFLLTYVNGDPGCREDDIIPESHLYDYICRMIDRITGEAGDGGDIPQESLKKLIDAYTADYVETLGGARRRLNRALEIILTSYYANILKLRADALVHSLRER